MLTALHGPGSPCAWLLQRMLDWGGSSGRIMLLLAAQLGALLEAQPRLALLHGPCVQRLMMWGMPADGGCACLYSSTGILSFLHMQWPVSSHPP